MKFYNLKALESLSLFCHMGGLFSVIIGIVVIFIDLFNKQYYDLQIGIFIMATGYAFVKIANKITFVVIDEKRNQF